MADPAPDASPCVACGYRDSIDGDFCLECRQSTTVSRYEEKQTKAAHNRNSMWAERSALAREWDNARQRVLRLERDVRPRQAAWPTADPWVVADEALERCTRVRKALGGQGMAREALDEVEEAIRVLAWGPEGRSSRP